MDVAHVLFAADRTPWPEGTVLNWCDGRAFGHGRRQSLRAMLGLHYDIERRDQRLDEGLYHMAPVDLLATVVGAIYRDDDRTDEQVRIDTRRFGRFLMKPSVMDGFYVVVLEGRAGSRIVCCDIDRHSVATTVLPDGTLEALLAELLAAIEAAIARASRERT